MVAINPSSVDDRKLRRMISNRESARRSRMRKQQHLEDLHCTLSRLQAQNRRLSDRLGSVRHYVQLFRIDSDLLRSESIYLRRRLQEIRRIVMLAQLQRVTSACGGGFAPVNNGQNISLSSLIA